MLVGVKDSNTGFRPVSIYVSIGTAENNLDMRVVMTSFRKTHRAVAIFKFL